MSRKIDESLVVGFLQDSTVRIATSTGIIGTGFFISHDQIVTCAHILRRARRAEAPSSPEVVVSWKGASCTASVTDCRPPDSQGADFYPYPDLALLTVVSPSGEHACAMLDEKEPSPDTRLMCRGVNKDIPSDTGDMDSVIFTYNGARDVRGQDEPPPEGDSVGRYLMNLAAGSRALRGMSGAPLLNLRTGRVCGVLKSSRNESEALGGWAIPISEVARSWPQAMEANRAFHAADKTWTETIESRPQRGRIIAIAAVAGAAAVAGIVSVLLNQPGAGHRPTHKAVTTVRTGNLPYGIAASSRNHEFYVANFGSDTVSAVNQDSLTVKNYLLGVGPTEVAVTPDGSKIYTTNSGSNTVSVIEPRNGTIKDLKVGSGPDAIRASPDGRHMYVTNNNGNSVSIISTSTNKVTSVIVGKKPYRTVTVGSLLYVTNNASNTVSVVNLATNKVIRTVTVGRGPYDIAATPDGEQVLVTDSQSNTISAISTTSLRVRKITVGESPIAIVVSPDGHDAYVANSEANYVSVVDLTSNAVRRIPVGNSPDGLAQTRNGRFVAVANYASSSVSLINTGSETVMTKSVGKNPAYIVVSPNNRYALVSNQNSASVSRIAIPSH